MRTYNDQHIPGYGVRENYRKQGRMQERERILELLEELEATKPMAAWSPNYIKNLVMKDQDED